MDCQEVRELLDAYSLGAAEQVEAEGLERHVADCVRCWRELNEAQRTAALLALSVALEEAPASLRDSILAQAKREASRERRLPGLLLVLKRGWPVAAGAVAVVGVAALALAAVLQMEMNDLRDENNQLAQQVQSSGLLLDQQQQLLAVLSAPDMQELYMKAASAEFDAVGVYYWSRAARKGYLVCNNLPDLEEGQVYQAWFLTDEEWVSAGTFEHRDGISQLAMDLGTLSRPPEAIGVSIEGVGGNNRPTGEMLLLGTLPPR